MTTSLLRHLLVFTGALVLGLQLSQPSFGQDTKPPFPASNHPAAFDELLLQFAQRQHRGSLLVPPLLYRDSAYAGTNPRQLRLQFTVRLAEQPLPLRCQAMSLKNPFGGAALPLSYSVVYRHCLVVLFSPGKFACYRLTDLSRDEPLEQQLNADQRFEQHATLNQQLVGWRNHQAYAYDTTHRAWHPLAQPLPFHEQDKLFEDERFVCSMSCMGEFGGRVRFYDKQTHRTHYVNATCGTSVWKQDGQYRLLASLAHMTGSARSAIIPAPEALPSATTPRAAVQDWQYASDSSVSNPAAQRVFGFHGLTMLGGMRWQNQTLYVVSWRGATFLATVAGEQITIVHPLFNSSLGHTGQTTGYGTDLSITSLLGYKGRHEREVTCLLTNGKQVTKIAWGR